MSDVTTIGDDTLEGAEAIAKFLFGEAGTTRRAYTAIKHGLPHFRIGNRLFARKSALADWIASQEKRGEPTRSYAQRRGATAFDSK